MRAKLPADGAGVVDSLRQRLKAGSMTAMGVFPEMNAITLKGLIRVAMLSNRGVMAGTVPEAYEWETCTAFRVLMRCDGTETDIVYDKVTDCWRLWIDGVECGDPECN